ncbi:MAG: 30S ribosomal protein S5 [Candidatus Magasanikbacteria bacterium]|jgi:small subunit ribosomal protein S5|nr:30S ribosomal protein S5 [Candidatus Magasanikbacteria bacterium]
MRKGNRRPKQKREKPEFDQQIIDLARVTRVTKGGKQMSFRVCIIIGDRKGRVGYGVAKGKDVQIAVGKAVAQAKKTMLTIPFVNETIPHRVEAKYKAAKVMIKPAPKGSGIIAGGATRTILELAGLLNASAKMLGKTNNKVTNAKVTFDALQKFLPRALAYAKKKQAVAPAKEVAVTEKPVKKAPVKKAPVKKAPVTTPKKVEKKESTVTEVAS